MTKPIIFDEEEIQQIIRSISEPTFRFIMRRMKKTIYDHERYKQISLAQFMMVITWAMGSVDANMLRFLENFHKLQSGEALDFDMLRTLFVKGLYEQLDVVLQ